MDCCVASYNRCVICDGIKTCLKGQQILSRGCLADRGPDAATNDYIYCRGEFDPFVPINRHELRKASEGFKDVIKKQREMVGLYAS